MADKDELTNLLEIGNILATDRLIKVYVGSRAEPYLIQQALLISLSDFFSRALAFDKSNDRDSGKLRFPDDRGAAWEFLLSWKLKDELPCQHTLDDDMQVRLLIHCWVLGDKYNIKEFQDTVMLELIECFSNRHVSFETVKLAFDNTPSSSPLRTLMAEAAVLRIEQSGCYDHREPDIMDGSVGFTSELMQAMDRYHEDTNSLEYSGRVEETKGWLRFMVGGGPKKHWIYQQ